MDFPALAAAAYTRMRDTQSRTRTPPRFRLKFHHHFEELRRLESQGKTAAVVNALAYLAALCQWYAEALESRADADREV